MTRIKTVEKIGKYITVDSAARRSGFGRTHIIWLANMGHIYAVRFAGVLGVDMESLDEYLVRRGKSVGQRSEGE